MNDDTEKNVIETQKHIEDMQDLKHLQWLQIF